MNFYDLAMTQKWKDVLKIPFKDWQVLFFEGPSQTSKSTISSVKLIQSVMQSPRGQTTFFLCGKSRSVVYRNFIEKDTGVTKLFPLVTKYIGHNGSGGERIEVTVFYKINGKTVTEIKKIFILGYNNVSSANDVLGGTPCIIFLDEVNKAHEQFIKECLTRVASVGTRIIATCNGDDPDMLHYQYLNACRPTEEYDIDVLESTREYMEAVAPKARWIYWFFGLRDRPLVTDQWLMDMYASHPVGSFEYNSKVLGIRGATDGLALGHIMHRGLIIDEDQINFSAITELIVGTDVGSGGVSTKKDNAKTIHVLMGYSRFYQRIIIMDSKESNEIEHFETVQEFNEWVRKWYLTFANKIRQQRIDSAEPALIATFNSHSENKGIVVGGSIKTSTKGKYPITLKSRLSIKQQLILKQRMLFVNNEGGRAVYANLAKIKEVKGEMLDENKKHNDYSDAVDYAITPNFSKLMSARLLT